MSAGRRIAIRGTVQGVGMRPWVYRLARAAGVGGRVSNDPAGVTIEAFGEPGDLEAFVAALRADAPPAARIRCVATEEIRDPADRRHSYAFTNCASCGPRFTIASGVPYDRAATTMHAFISLEHGETACV